MNTRFNFKSLAFHLLVPIMLLFIILMLVPGYGNYYNMLVKPFPALPSFVFFGIYILMYFLIGISAFLVDIRENVKERAFNYYYISLLINLFYIPIMFGTKSLLVGFLWSVLLLIFVFLTFKEFRKVNRTSGMLFIIYFVFTILLTYYSLMLYFLNT